MKAIDLIVPFTGPGKSGAAALYESLLPAARAPVLYERGGRPDTVQGRFDVLALHGALAAARLGQETSSPQRARKLAQDLFDRLFRDVDVSLREIGIGDLSVPRHMRRMMTGFHGRTAALAAVLGDKPGLREVLRRNLPGVAAREASLNFWLEYVYSNAARLQDADLETLESGAFIFEMPVWDED